MKEQENLVGKRFGRLVVRERAEYGEEGTHYLCDCDCQNTIITSEKSLLDKSVRSCGCLRIGRSPKGETMEKYGHERAFHVWANMLGRCYDPSNRSYDYYGARGIRVCQEWVDSYEAFKSFIYSKGWKDDAPFGKYTLDRIDNDKGYYPQNCRVVSMQVQALNKSSNHVIDYKGEKMTITEAAKLNGLTNHQVFNRLNKGWDLIEALETPLTSSKTYSVNGEAHTISEWAKIMGVTDATIRGRLRTQPMKMIHEEWKTKGSLEVGDFSIKYEVANGETHPRRYWADLIGINEATLRKLLSSFTMQEVYDDWNSHGGRLSLIRSNKLEEANGESHNRKEWAKILGISVKCLRNNLKKYTMQEVYDKFKNNIKN